MSLNLANYRKRTRLAVREFWQQRHQAHETQARKGGVDRGERSGVTAGRNMDGFISLVHEIAMKNGKSQIEIQLGRRLLTLPGYYRPTKIWDVLLLSRGTIVAALEFKSQVGPSFGNNFNNRCEEAIGSSLDFWTAFREGAFGDGPRPFVGWYMLLEESPRSIHPVRDGSVHFPIFPEFNDASYADRYRILCEKLMRENLCTTATLVLTNRKKQNTGSYRELSEATGMHRFVATLAGHIASVTI
ncbi:MAG: restriction endonuclease [Bacteroidetes bacterium]|nr:restriction endonuclease [Bacteroidota bacterium]